MSLTDLLLRCFWVFGGLAATATGMTMLLGVPGLLITVGIWAICGRQFLVK